MELITKPINKMKKLFQKIVSVFLVLCLINLQGYASVGMFGDTYSNANDSEFASFDEDAFYSEFQDIEALETYLSTNDASFDEVDASLLVNVSSNSILPLAPAVSDGPPLGIPSFLWGCILGWVGLLIVYLMADDSAETKKALWGCIISTVVWGGGYFLAY